MLLAHYYDTKQGDSNWNDIDEYDLTMDNTTDIFDLVVVATNFWHGIP